MELLNTLAIASIPSALTGILTWFLSKRKYQAEVVTGELSNVETAIKIWRESAEEWKKRAKDVELAMDEMRKALVASQEEVMLLRAELMEVKTELMNFKQKGVHHEKTSVPIVHAPAGQLHDH